MNGNFRNFAIWLVILFMLMGLFQVFQSSTRSISVADKSYSQFVTDIAHDLRTPLMARGFHGITFMSRPPVEKQSEAASTIAVPKRRGFSFTGFTEVSDLLIMDLL